MDLKEKAMDLISEFKPAAIALKNKTTVLLATLLITILGVTAYIEMPRENFPEIKIPTIFVGITYPGNSPKDMENLITRHIEKEIKTLNGVTKIFKSSPTGNFYFLDSEGKRIIVTTNDGDLGDSLYLKQYLLDSDQVGNLKDLYVDAEDARLYVLDEKKLYAIDLQGN